MSSRDEKKRQTRQALMNAALELVGRGENFSSVSLREVAKTAGVVPTSFYRHFQDMEELGLNLADEFGMMLRRLMRATRQDKNSIDDQIRNSVEVFVHYVANHRTLFIFMSQCRTGGTPALRNAIRNELRYFGNELVTDIRTSGLLPEVDLPDMEMIADLIVIAVADAATRVLDLPEGNQAHLNNLIEHTIKQVRLIFLGATQWKSRGA